MADALRQVSLAHLFSPSRQASDGTIARRKGGTELRRRAGNVAADRHGHARCDAGANAARIACRVMMMMMIDFTTATPSH
eukprot:80263-Chlamydomonas_euryale.AAC.10